MITTPPTVESLKLNPINMHTLLRPDITNYPILGDEVDWFTGVTELHNQLLVVYQFPDVVVVSFTADGRISQLRSPPGLPIDEASGFFSTKDDEILREWLRQVGFQPGLIKVKRFMLPQYHIGIRDVAPSYTSVLLNANVHSQEELLLAQREVEHWSNQGLFELSLNEHTNLWIDKAGTIVAT
jgi:hypothetical protein